jgi:hypothetical protein
MLSYKKNFGLAGRQILLFICTMYISNTCNLGREIMWPDLQALDLGAIQSIAAFKKASLDLGHELLQ